MDNRKKYRLFLAMCIVMAVAVFAMIEVFLVFFDESLLKSDDDDVKIIGTYDTKASKFDADGYMYIDGTKRVGELEFSDIRIKLLKSEKCEFLASVENLSQEYLNTQSVEISVIDESGEVDEVFAGLLTELAPYEKNSFKTQVLSDITDALDVEIKVTEL